MNRIRDGCESKLRLFEEEIWDGRKIFEDWRRGGGQVGAVASYFSESTCGLTAGVDFFFGRISKPGLGRCKEKVRKK